MKTKQQIISQISYDVSQSNDLISNMRIPLTLNQQKLVLLAISMVRPTDKEFHRYTISVADFCQMTGTDKESFYRDFRELVKDFKKRQAEYSKWIVTEDVEFASQWFSEIDYVPKVGAIRMIFDSHLVPHLLNLTRNFTRYELWCVLRMRGKYSIRLYQRLKRDTYDRDIFTKEYKIEDLKRILLASNYEKFKDLRVRAIDPAVNEINECSDIHVTYKVKKDGKKADIIEFTAQKKNVDDTYRAYTKVLEQINKEQKQIPGQISIFDRPEEDFIGDGSRTIQILGD